MFAGQCHASYALSLFRLIPVFMNAGMAIQYAYTTNESLVPRARDSLVYDFLATECTHLMFIDADIGFKAEDILTMIEADKEIICGVYPRKEIDWTAVAEASKAGVPPAELHKYTGAPVVNTLAGSQPIEASAGGEPVEVANAGTGFMLIKRIVFEWLADVVPPYGSQGKFFRQYFGISIDPDTGTLLSEDFHFCDLAREHGCKVWVAPWVELTHTGPYTFGGDR